MSTRDQKTILIKQFNGWWNRGAVEVTPINHFQTADNLAYEMGEGGNSLGRLFSRAGFTLHLNVGTAIKRIHRFQFASEAGSVRYMVLVQSGGNSIFYDSVVGFATPLKTYAATLIDDFSLTVIGDRVYVTPHDRLLGTFNELLQIYAPGTIRTHALGVGGAGYVVGDILTINTGNAQATVKVTTVAAGVITAYTLETAGGLYTTGVKSTVGGTGSGATINITAVSSTMRDAAGLKPSGFTLRVAISATAGTVEAGRHLFAVAYETESGFITQPGPVAWTLYNAPGAFKVDLTAIPVGPTGTIARHILASKVIFDYNSVNFNQLEHELFFIPSGRIANNTATTLTIDFLDSQLLSSADFLLDLRETIPASVFITDYNGRLALGGFRGLVDVSTKPNPLLADKSLRNTVMYSNPWSPETIDATNGFQSVNPSDVGGSVVNGADLKGYFYIFKRSRTYATQDNGDVPANWLQPALIDGGIGAGSPFAVSQVLDSGGFTAGKLLIADYSGLRVFNGSYEDIELTWKVQDAWREMKNQDPSYVQVLLDPITRKVFVSYPSPESGSALPNTILYGDYSNGLDSNAIKWSKWNFTDDRDVKSIYFAPRTATTKNRFPLGMAPETSVRSFYQLHSETTDLSLDGSAALTIPWDLITTLLAFDEDIPYRSQLEVVRFRVTGAGVATPIIRGLDGVADPASPLTLATITMVASPGSFVQRPVGMKSQMFSVELVNAGSIAASMALIHLSLHGKSLQEEPSGAI